MNIETYHEIKKQTGQFKYNSLQYTEFEEFEEYDLHQKDEKLILIHGYSKEKGLQEIHWAANDASVLIEAIQQMGHNILVSFVPDEWKKEFDNHGFVEYGVLREYWIAELSIDNCSIMSCVSLQREEYIEASEVTRSCRLQSREFLGESPEWIELWMAGREANAVACGCTDCNILVHKIMEQIAGIICVGLYGHESEKGSIVWIREIAVRPEYQGQGIGKQLLLQGLKYGKEHGARRAFLMADEINHNAIRLYKKVGFNPNMDEVQIDMIYV
jgi:ribosomal protein S18 acetylase RimI-like enzyme